MAGLSECFPCLSCTTGYIQCLDIAHSWEAQDIFAFRRLQSLHSSLPATPHTDTFRSNLLKPSSHHFTEWDCYSDQTLPDQSELLPKLDAAFPIPSTSHAPRNPLRDNQNTGTPVQQHGFNFASIKFQYGRRLHNTDHDTPTSSMPSGMYYHNAGPTVNK